MKTSPLLPLVALLLLAACETPTTPDPGADGSIPPGPDGSAGACTSDSQCDDGLFCNGEEACLPADPSADARGCVAGAEIDCPAERCDETSDRCLSECPVPDADGDGHASTACGGDDCDDSDPLRYPGAVEVCDDIDQDCDPTSFGTVDADADGYIASRCCNPQVDGSRLCGPDCQDGNASISPMGTETCNGMDDDCDGVVDGAAAASSCTLFGVAETSCEAGACVIVACEAGRADCDAMTSTGCEVELATSAMHCAMCGMTCMAAGGTAICRDGTCDVDTCAAGTHRCDPGVCVDDTSVETCGSRCDPCFDPAHGDSTCSRPSGSTSYQCGIACDSGYAAVGGDCVAVAPVRPVAPLSGTIVTSLRPNVRVQLPVATDGFRIEACIGARDCGSPFTIDVSGSMGVLADGASELPAGTVVFWRARGLVGSGPGAVASTAVGPWWHFWTRPTMTIRNTTTGLIPDFDGDSHPDILVGASGGVYVAAGSGGASAFASPARVGTATSSYAYAVGDLNGDGYIDAMVQSSMARGSCAIWYGSSSGLRSGTARPTGLTSCSRAMPLGDTNGDGYADVGVVDTGRSGGGVVAVVLGGATMPTLVPMDFPWVSTSGRGTAYMELAGGDTNGDGYGDLHVFSSSQVRTYRGGPDGLGAATTTSLSIGTGTITGIAPAGDLNRDGYADLVTRVHLAPLFTPELDRFYVWSGGASALTRGVWFGVNAEYAIGAPDPLGNADGIDGFDDILLTTSTEVQVYKGSASGLTTPHAGAVTGTAARGTGPAGADRQPGLAVVTSSTAVEIYVAVRGALPPFETQTLTFPSTILNLSAATP